MITKSCQTCSKPFNTYPSMQHVKYCSQACYHSTKGGKITTTCEQCGASVESYAKKPKRFCNKSCARTFTNLTAANPSFHRDITGDKNPMFGKGMKGTTNPMFGKRKELSPRWKGGRKVRTDGYVLVIAPDDHPYPADQHAPSNLKYILEHRYVMEQRLGRYLLPTEVVHHINENPSDNRIENLQLFATQAEHVAHHQRMK